MSEERLFTWRNPWFRASVGGTALVFVFSVAVGFIWLPSPPASRNTGSPMTRLSPLKCS
jgi:hypothetical protein